MQTFEQIKAAHQRAEDSTKGAGDWLADFAADAHEHRGILIAEVERLSAALANQNVVEPRTAAGSLD
jgi:hypothetical protein